MIIVGSKAELFSMVDNNKRTKRYTALKYFLTKDVKIEVQENAQEDLFSGEMQ